MLYVSVRYGKLQFLGIKLVDFCLFYILNQQNNTFNPVMIAKETSADTQKSKNAILKILVHEFSEGVRTTVPWYKLTAVVVIKLE